MRERLKCDACAGDLVLVTAEAFVQGRAETGSEYHYACACGSKLVLLDNARWTITLIRLVGSAIICAGTAGFGVCLVLLTTAEDWSYGSNDPAAVRFITGFFLLLGLGGLALVARRARHVLGDRRRSRLLLRE